MGRIVLSSDELFRDASWFAVVDGQGERPGDHNPLVEAVGRDENLRQLAALRADIAKTARLCRLSRKGFVKPTWQVSQGLTLITDDPEIEGVAA